MNRQWILQKRPADAVTPDCFRYDEVPRAARPAAGHVLVRWELLLCAPTIRNWISGNRQSYYPTVELGTPVMGLGVGWVVDSDTLDYPVGTRVFGTGSWQDEQWVDPAAGGYRRIPDNISSVDALGILGINALTAYVGLVRIGQPKTGDTLLVSGAAGSVGSVAAQLGRILGCRVIGICGGESKKRWLRDRCGIPDLIDYKSDEVVDRLDALAQKGVDIYFDNVGGPLLRDVIARTNRFGRIVVCGQISTYDMQSDSLTPPLDMMRIVYGNIRIEGFIARAHSDLFGEALEKLALWDREGRIAHREDVRPGFKDVPDTFRLLFSGGNEGTLIARIADASGQPL